MILSEHALPEKLAELEAVAEQQNPFLLDLDLDGPTNQLPPPSFVSNDFIHMHS